MLCLSLVAVTWPIVPKFNPACLQGAAESNASPPASCPPSTIQSLQHGMTLTSTIPLACPTTGNRGIVKKLAPPTRPETRFHAPLAAVGSVDRLHNARDAP